MAEYPKYTLSLKTKSINALVRLITTTISIDCDRNVVTNKIRKRSLSPDLAECSTNAVKKSRLENARTTNKVKVASGTELTCGTEVACVRHLNEELKENSSVKKKKTIVTKDAVTCLRLFLKCLPLNLWNDIFEAQLDYFQQLEATKRHKIFHKMFDFLLCKRVIQFSTDCLQTSDEEEHSYAMQRLHLCSNLRKLDIKPLCFINKDFFDKNQLQIYFGHFFNIETLKVIPSKGNIQCTINVFPALAASCPLLKDLTIFYSISDDTPTAISIGCLVKCHKLRYLSLHSFGNATESDLVIKLLLELQDLTFIYHRELPNALMQIYYRCLSSGMLLPQFQLRSVLMEGPLLNFGYQKLYISSGNLSQIGMMCPFLKHIHLLNPATLSEPLEHFPELTSLHLQDVTFETSLKEALQQGLLNNLTSLKLQNLTLTNCNIYTIAKGCCYLTTLHISDATFQNEYVSSEWIDQLNTPLFIHLQNLTLLPTSIQYLDTNFLTDSESVTWDTSKNVSVQLIRDSLHLKLLHIKLFDCSSEGSRNRILHIISECSQLEDVLLLDLPGANYNVVADLVSKCKNLKRLRNLQYWGLTQEDIEKVRNKYNYLL